MRNNKTVTRQKLFQTLFPIFFYLFVGIALKALKKDFSDALVGFIIYVSFPALIIEKLYYLKMDSGVADILLIGYICVAVGGVLSFVAAKLLRLSRQSAASFILVGTLGNTSFIGFPFVVGLLGEGALVYATLFDQLTAFVALMSFGVFVASWGAGERFDIRRTVRDIALFPPFIAVVASLLLRFVQLPQPLHIALSTLGSTLVPIVVVAVGMKLSFAGAKSSAATLSVALFLKLAVVPAIMLLLVRNFFDLGLLSTKTALLECAMPPMIMSMVFAKRYGLDEELAVSAVGIGTLVAFLSLPMFVNFF